MLLVRRQPIRFISRYKCFTMNEEQTSTSSTFHLRIPYIDTCYNLTIFKNISEANEQMYARAEATIPLRIISGLLHSIGIVQFKNSSLSGMFQVSSINEFMPDMTTLQVRQFINNSTVIGISRFGPLSKTLKLDCSNTAVDIEDRLEQCSGYSGNKKLCHFTCPNNCDEMSSQISNVWQIRPFEYLFSSSICQAAYHSNVLGADFTGNLVWNPIYFGSKTSKEEAKFTVLNNKISAYIWPSQLKSKSLSAFRFDGNIQLRNELADLEKGANVLVLLKAVFLPNEPQKAIIYHSKNFSPKNLRLRSPFKSDNSHYKLESTNEESVLLTWFSKHSDSIYWELSSNLSLPVKFPLNTFTPDSQMSTYQQHVLRLPNTKISMHQYEKTQCQWYYNNVATEQTCASDLNLNFTYIADIENHFVIIQPGSQQIFTRVFINQIPSPDCQHQGIIANKFKNCSCYHGFNGSMCENSCDQNKFGPNCQLTCPKNNCKGFLLCGSDPIGCSCLPGYTGFDCNQLIHLPTSRDTHEDSILKTHQATNIDSNSVKERTAIFQSPLTMWMLSIASIFFVAIVCKLKEKGFKLVYTVEEFEPFFDSLTSNKDKLRESLIEAET